MIVSEMRNLDSMLARASKAGKFAQKIATSFLLMIAGGEFSFEWMRVSDGSMPLNSSSVAIASNDRWLVAQPGRVWNGRQQWFAVICGSSRS
jgi:hypothetical protein